MKIRVDILSMNNYGAKVQYYKEMCGMDASLSPASSSLFIWLCELGIRDKEALFSLIILR